MAEIILHRVSQRYELARGGISPHRYRMLFKGILYSHYIFAKEEEAARWKVSIRSFHMTDDSTGGDRDNGAMRQAQRFPCLKREEGVRSRCDRGYLAQTARAPSCP